MIDEPAADSPRYLGDPRVIDELLGLAVSDFMDVLSLGDREKTLKDAKEILQGCAAIFQGRDSRCKPVKAGTSQGRWIAFALSN